LLFIEDIQEVLKSVKISYFLQLLDGFQTKEGSLVIATGNDLRYIEDNLTNRPRRFDRIIEFPLPTKNLARAYLKKWFADIVTDEDYDLMVESAVRREFTYAHLQEVYFLSVFYAVQNDREDPNRGDVLRAIDEVVKVKALADRGFEAPRRSITDYGSVVNEE
jgi:ATP-dependent 26S proteasome regulatory subunit